MPLVPLQTHYRHHLSLVSVRSLSCWPLPSGCDHPPNPSKSLPIKSISLWFTKKDAVGSHVKGFTEVQIKDTCNPSLVLWASHSISGGCSCLREARVWFHQYTSLSDSHSFSVQYHSKEMKRKQKRKEKKKQISFSCQIINSIMTAVLMSRRWIFFCLSCSLKS